MTAWVLLAVDTAEQYLLASTVTASLWKSCGFSVACIISSENTALPPSIASLTGHLQSECSAFFYTSSMDPRLSRIAYLAHSKFPKDDVFLFSNSDTAPVNCTYFKIMAERAGILERNVVILDKPVQYKPRRRYAMCYMFAKRNVWLKYLGFHGNVTRAYQQMLAWGRSHGVDIKRLDEFYIGHRAAIWEHGKHNLILDNVRDYDQNPRLPPRPYTWNTVFGS